VGPIELFGDLGTAIDFIDEIPPHMPAEVSPADAPRFVEFHDLVRDSVRQSDSHVHRELRSEIETSGSIDSCSSDRARSIDEVMLARISEEVENVLGTRRDEART
jgi:hypothetical protein